MNDSFARHQLFIFDYFLHNGRYRRFNLIVVLIAAADRKVALGITIHQQDTLSFTRESHAEIKSRCRFAYAAFLVGNGNHFTFAHIGLLLSRYSYHRAGEYVKGHKKRPNLPFVHKENSV